jgi:hypothetical protein
MASVNAVLGKFSLVSVRYFNLYRLITSSRIIPIYIFNRKILPLIIYRWIRRWNRRTWKATWDSWNISLARILWWPSHKYCALHKRNRRLAQIWKSSLVQILSNYFARAKGQQGLGYVTSSFSYWKCVSFFWKMGGEGCLTFTLWSVTPMVWRSVLMTTCPVPAFVCFYFFLSSAILFCYYSS